MLTIFQKVVLSSKLVNVKLPDIVIMDIWNYSISLLLSENLNIYLMSVMNFEQIFIILFYKISLV